MSKRVVEVSKLVFTEAPGSNFISEGQSFIEVGFYHSNSELIYSLHNGVPKNVTFTPETIFKIRPITIEPDCTLTSQVPLGQLGNPLSISPSSVGASLVLAGSLHIDVQNGHSLCITQNVVPVIIRLDGTLTLEDVSHAPVEVDMHIGSTINVTHNNQNFTFTNPADGSLGNDGFVCLGDVYKLVNICSTIKGTNISQVESFEDIIKYTKCFQAYQGLDHAVVTEFMKQNNIPPAAIDSFCGKHFFEMNAIAKSLPETEDCFIKMLEGTDVMELICFYIDNQVNVNGDDNQANGGAIDLAGDNNQNPDGGAA